MSCAAQLCHLVSDDAYAAKSRRAFRFHDDEDFHVDAGIDIDHGQERQQ
jgi:hypothetical protein